MPRTSRCRAWRRRSTCCAPSWRVRSTPRPPSLSVFASHDMALPRLRETALAQRLRLDLHFLGSLDGLRALADGRCPVAGFHAPIIEPAGSAYVRQLKPLLRPGTHKLIGFARRMQGLIVAPGNPLGIRTVADLGRPGLLFVARQTGSGTRLLTDALLESAGLEQARIVGPERCEDSHLAVAASVACAVADAGLGIEAAARSFGLDFVPLVEERYCFVCLKPSLEHPAVPDGPSGTTPASPRDPAVCGRVPAAPPLPLPPGTVFPLFPLFPLFPGTVLHGRS